MTGELDPAADLYQAHLRRDGEPLNLLAVHHRDPTGVLTTGIRTGADAVFTIEPLAVDAAVTVRHTTAIRWIRRIDLSGLGPDDDWDGLAPSNSVPTTVPELVAARGADQWASVADVAAAIAAELAGQADRVFAVRLLAEGIRRFRETDDHDGAQAQWLTLPPPSTRDLGFDTLIAGTAQHLAHEQRHRVPDWARTVPPLKQPWAPLGRWTPPATHTWRELDALNVTLDTAFVDDV
ncbi:MAG: hypothetical protein HGA44_01875 [Cellulomonadaceae bacterium]|nr:hypothetical protein [Cellulomonadaceae bacterium]